MNVAELLQALLQRFDALVRVVNQNMGFQATKYVSWFQYSIHHDFAANWQAGAEQASAVNISAEAFFVVTAVSGAMVLLEGDDTNSIQGEVITTPVIGTPLYAHPDELSGSFLYELTDGSSDRKKQDQLTEAAAGLGTANHPTELPRAWILRPNANVSSRVRPNFAARDELDELRIAIVLHGFKVFRGPEYQDLTRGLTQ